MGIGDWVLGLGFTAEELAKQVATRAGAVPLQWPTGLPPSLVYRLPRDPHQRASIFSAQQTIVVNEGELAVVLEDGKSNGALEPGRYVFKKSRVTGALDIVWVKTGQQALKWGIGNVTSMDGIQTGANGMLYVRLRDAIVFNTEIVQGAATLTELDLQRLLMPRVQGVIRSTIARWGAVDLQAQRDLFTNAVKEVLSETFAKMGLGIVDLEVIEVSLPPEFKAAVAQATLTTHASRAALIDAQVSAQLAQLQASALAQAQLTAGLAQAQIMAQLQAQGIDPLKLKALEALNTMAANPTTGTVIGGDPRGALFGQVAMAAMVGGPLGPMTPPPSAQLPPSTAPAQPLPVESAADIERQLDQLVDRLASGAVSEETYKKLSARLEAKLANLK